MCFIVSAIRIRFPSFANGHRENVTSVALQLGKTELVCSIVADSWGGRGQVREKERESGVPALLLARSAQGHRESASRGGVPSVLPSAPRRCCAALTMLSRLPSPRQPRPSVIWDVARGEKKPHDNTGPSANGRAPYACCLIRPPSLS